MISDFTQLKLINSANLVVMILKQQQAWIIFILFLPVIFKWKIKKAIV